MTGEEEGVGEMMEAGKGWMEVLGGMGGTLDICIYIYKTRCMVWCGVTCFSAPSP